MNHQAVRRLLEDYFDDELAAEEARAVEEHLLGCSECRAELTAWRALRRDAAGLPRSIQPSRDLWQAISAGLDRERLRDRSVWSLRYPLAAAAVLLVLLSSTLTILLSNRGSEGRVARESAPEAEPAPDATLVSRWRAAEEEYLRATGELLDALDASRSEIRPATLELIERNLRIIDRAIQESRAALAADPANQDVVRLLSASYEKKIDLLRYANRLAAEL